MPVFDLWRRVGGLVSRLGRIRAAALRAALDVARRGAPPAQVDEVVTVARRHVDLLAMEVVHLGALLEHRIPRPLTETPPPLQPYKREASVSGA